MTYTGRHRVPGPLHAMPLDASNVRAGTLFRGGATFAVVLDGVLVQFNIRKRHQLRHLQQVIGEAIENTGDAWEKTL